MIDLFLKLAEKGVDLLKERRQQRNVFLVECINPLHAVFRQLCLEHEATFRRLDEGLCDPNIKISDLAQSLERSRLFERHTILTLHYRIDAMKSKDGATVEIKPDFDDYLDATSICLQIPEMRLRFENSEIPKPATILYYSQATQAFQSHWYSHPNRGELQMQLRKTIDDFQRYRAGVESAYMSLRTACSV